MVFLCSDLTMGWPRNSTSSLYDGTVRPGQAGVNKIGKRVHFIRLLCIGHPLSTEYEQLLAQLLDERHAKLAKLTSQKGKERQIDDVRAEIRYIELEIEHYQKALALFRTGPVPKVGRWGRPEEEEHKSPAA